MTFVQLCMKAGPLVLLMALVSLPFFYVNHRSAPQSKRQLSLAKFLYIVLVPGLLAFTAGTAVGIGLACAPNNAGNLCGLGGFFGVGPLFSGLVMGLTAWGCTR